MVKRFIIVMSVLLVILVGGGIGLFAYLKNAATEQILDYVNTELEENVDTTEVQEIIGKDQLLQSFIAEGANIAGEELPFTTKEEAMSVVVNKVGLSNLQSIYSQVQQGSVSSEELITLLEDKLTEDEVQALKMVAYQTIYK